ncbi:MAG: hypothetical protein LQ338_005910 [Usnochroma carphineum]|nr:MAG: hypothetical protein LQ338_005910 [Usnochroma carphineum]
MSSHRSEDEPLSRLPDLFNVAVKKVTTCSQCRRQDFKGEISNPLIIPPKGEINIDQAIGGVLETEVISGLQCECSKDEVTKELRRTIARGPDILCTQFNRFSQYQKPGDKRVYTRKNTEDIAFGEILDLSHYVDNKTPLRYRLLAAIHHVGRQDSGHYISVTRTPEGTWEHQNDERVKTVTLEDATQSAEGFTPYLLFWEKLPLPEETQTSPSSKKRSREALEDPDQDDPHPSRSKSPKTDRSPADSPQKQPKSTLTSLFKWPTAWLYGTQQTEKAPSEDREEHERKDRLIQSQKDLIRRAALTHCELITTCNRLNSALEASRRATDRITPLMRDMEARGGKHSGKARDYLTLMAKAEEREKAGLARLKENERMAKLMENAEQKRNQTFNELLAGVVTAMSEDKLGSWLDDELRDCELPRGRWGE